MARRLDPAKSDAIIEFLELLMERYKDSGPNAGAAAFFLPGSGGYAFDSNFVVYRTSSCPLVSSARSFISPRSHVQPWYGDIGGPDGVARALESSIGAIEFPLELVPRGLEELTFEIERRLSLPWAQEEPIQPKRVCVVMEQGCARDMKGWWETAASLGIKLVILSTGSWWADGCGVLEDMRESFISSDMKAYDPGFWEKIVEIVKSYPHPIDGIFAPTDPYLVSVAQAAEALNLWTPGPLPFSRSTDKHATRKLLDPEGDHHFAIKSLPELDKRLASKNLIPFPVICKPAKSASSEGVYKVNNEPELRDVVARVLTLKQSVHGILVEPYVDGPEVDVNLVLLDGRLLYAEVVDEFPTMGDLVEDSSKVRFQETQALVPSHLPVGEQSAMIDDMVKVVKLQGFDTGVYHCEARVCNSSMSYTQEPGDPFPKLEPKADAPEDGKRKTYAYIHEVNARGPAQLSSASSLACRGIDLWQLQILIAVGDKLRFEALSTPFLHDEKCSTVIMTGLTRIVSQELLSSMYPGQPKYEYDNRTVDGEYDPMPHLYRKHAVTKHIVRHRSKAMHSKGLEGTGGHWIWVNEVVVCSSQDRKHTLEIVQDFTGIYQDYVKEMDRIAQE